MNETNTLEIPESSGLIRQNVRDQAIEKIKGFQICNSNHWEKQKLDEATTDFIRGFIQFSHQFLNISREQLGAFSVDEAKEIDNLIAEKSKPWMITQKILFTCMLLIPLMGWSIAGAVYHGKYSYGDDILGTGDPHYRCWAHLRNRKALRKAYGKNYFPYEELIKTLRG